MRQDLRGSKVLVRLGELLFTLRRSWMIKMSFKLRPNFLRSAPP